MPTNKSRPSGREKPIPQPVHALRILEQIERHPDTTQSDLASRLGVAIGTINWYVKRLTAKGYVKISQLQRRRVRYLITPKGITEKARLAYQYVQISMNLYKRTRTRAGDLLDQVHAAGYNHVRIEGDGDLADVCRLTCLERGVQVLTSARADLPAIVIAGTELALQLPARAAREAGLP